MSWNATHRFTNTAVLTLGAIEAPQVVTSDAFDERLADTYRRVGMRAGMLERVVGIKERRWWPEGYTFVDGAVAAGAKAIGEAGVDPARIGLMVNTSVSRAYRNVRLVDWYSASQDHPELFAGDGYHLTPDGSAFYATLIADATDY